MTVKEIIIAYCKEHYPEADGICFPQIECGCGFDDFEPCGNSCEYCVPAKYNEETEIWEEIIK